MTGAQPSLELSSFPLPFASGQENCFLASVQAYKEIFTRAGFSLEAEADKHEFVMVCRKISASNSKFEVPSLSNRLHIFPRQSSMVGTTNRIAQYSQAHGSPPQLSLAVVMGSSLGLKAKNCLSLFHNGELTAAELAFSKPNNQVFF